MSRKEVEQSKVFEQINLKQISQVEAAAKLKISPRWINKKLKRYRELGDKGLIHVSRGKISPKRIPSHVEELILKLARDEWKDFGPTFFSEKLLEIHRISISSETIRRILLKAGYWVLKKKRSKHRKWRERKPMFGMLIQLDGSKHAWFEGRGKAGTLIAAIDDATSQIVGLQFAQAESVIELLTFTRNYVLKNGIPQEFYTDFGSVYHVNLNNKDGSKKTQWESVCQLLHCATTNAHSPEAKGRIERLFETLQDRLIKELRLAGISNSVFLIVSVTFTFFDPLQKILKL